MKRVIYFFILSILWYGCVHELGETSKVESIYYDGDNKAGLNLVKKLDEQNQKEELEKVLDLKCIRLVLDNTCFGMGFREEVVVRAVLQVNMNTRKRSWRN